MNLKIKTSYMVPLFFLIVNIIGFYFSGLSGGFLANEMVNRMSRNLILVMSLLIPVTSGTGLNFGIVIGAMAGQIGLFFALNFKIAGMLGIVVAMLVAIPVGVFFGKLVAIVLNRAKGNEMITSMILGYFANGIYQLAFIVLAGRVIPFREHMILNSGSGLKNTMDLISIRKAFDNLFFGDITKLPIMPLVFSAFLFVLMYYFYRTKLGQELRSVGQDMGISEVSGIDVDKTRTKSIIISTVLAAWGQIVFLQNIGTLNTYTNHEQVGLFSVAALLIGGASIDRATWKEAVIGTFLFHMLFVVSPAAGQRLFGDAQVGEYFRVFVAYGVIGVSLILHALQKRRALKVVRIDEIKSTETNIS